MSRTEFARMVGFSTSYLANIENGHDLPSPKFLHEVAVALGLPQHVLLDGVPFKARTPGKQVLMDRAAEIRGAFGYKPPSIQVSTLKVAYREAQYTKLGIELVSQLNSMSLKSARAWKAVKYLPREMNGPEQMVALHLFCDRADVQELQPRDVCFPRPVLVSPGHWWLAVVLNLPEDGRAVLFPQLNVRTKPGQTRCLDFLAAVASDGRREDVDVEVDGPGHRVSQAEDRAREQEVGLKTLRITDTAVNRRDFAGWFKQQLWKIISP